MTDLNGALVLVTGAGGGFGQHMTRQFREAGARLILSDVSDALLASSVDLAGESLVAAIKVDLADAGGCRALVDGCLQQAPLPDVIVNNAGIGASGRLDLVPDEMWEKMMQLNLLAPMRLVRAFLPGLVERGSGHIVNISSLAGWVGSRGLSAYCASKYGLRGFGEALAEDVAGKGIRVTNVYPCFSRTPILDSPQFGTGPRRKVPASIISEPADVVAEILAGIRDDRLHVFPDPQARRVHLLKRFAPWALAFLNRRLERSAVRHGTETA